MNYTMTTLLHSIVSALGGYTIYIFLDGGWTPTGFNIFYGMLFSSVIGIYLNILKYKED